MKPNLLKLLTFFFVLFVNLISAQEIWRESFSIPGKGVWGDVNGTTVHQDFDENLKWSLDFENIEVSSPDDYAKTVTTSGGRFECRDINGEVIWRSEEIDISAYSEVDIQLLAQETGSGSNEQTKYLKAYYKIDDSEEVLFRINGENVGNWGSKLVEQKGLAGKKLEIVVYMNTHYAADKVILDEVVVFGEVEPVVIDRGDALINEILFNPISGGEDYVEIYNNSNKQIPTSQLYLASRDKNLELTQIYPLSSERLLFQSGGYLVLTKDTNGVFPWFAIECNECFLQMEKFPSFNNDEDYVVLLNEKLEVIDELFYTDKMHSTLLADEEGIALERISFEAETKNPQNWHSASSESGYGTPGYKNSQVQNDNVIKPIVTFESESFSPNLDGYNDLYKIHYEFEKPGYYANVTIFDAAGGLVLQLSKNELLGTSGEIIWNGEDETGQRQNLGVYIALVEVFDLHGNVYRFKDGVVLTDILE